MILYGSFIAINIMKLVPLYDFDGIESFCAKENSVMETKAKV